MSVRAYIDGFNLYMRAIRYHNIRWVDLSAMVESVCHVEVNHTYYFTARVRAEEDDPSKHVRQDVYIRALRATGHTVVEGVFRRDPKWRKPKGTLNPIRPKPEFVRVWIDQEKGSDVNLAIHLVRDVYEGDVEHAVVVTNDRDQRPAIELSLERGITVTTVNPDRDAESVFQPMSVDYPLLSCLTLRRSDLVRGMMPDRVNGPDGPIKRPLDWEA